MKNNKFIIPIVAPTCRRFEKYCDGLLELMDKNWPGHPTVWFVSDGRSIRHKNKICIESQSWVERLYRALRLIKRRTPGMEYVFMILEENFPLFHCDQKKMIEIQEVAIRYKLNCVSFHSIALNWPKVSFNKIKLHVVPQNYYYYSQNSIGIWRLEHLLKTCQYALKHNIHTGWLFEKIITSGHYASEYQWPNLSGGFFQRGWVNLEALKKVQLPEGQKLKEILMDEYLQQQFGREFAREKNKAEMSDMVFVLKVVGNKQRLKILNLLKDVPLTFETIKTRHNLSPAKLLQQLKILLSTRLVVQLKEPKMVRYCLNPSPDTHCFYAAMLRLIKDNKLE